MQLKWSWMVNVLGCGGKNIAADLHTKHLNRECKSSPSGLGANIKYIGRMQSILHQYNQVNGACEVSGHHTRHSASVDRDKILKQLQESKVFNYKAGRKDKTFPRFSTNLVTLSCCELQEWMQERM